MFCKDPAKLLEERGMVVLGWSSVTCPSFLVFCLLSACHSFSQDVAEKVDLHVTCTATTTAASVATIAEQQ